jgi:hypothetical protein
VYNIFLVEGLKILKKVQDNLARLQQLTHVILATQEAEIRRITV